MGKKKRSESNFLVQGSILAIASVLSRIIGLIYRVPLTAIIGDIGNDYYGAAMEVYSILLLISSYSLPLAVSKLVSTRVAKGERKNAYRVFKAALVFATISGTAAALVVYFGAGEFTRFLKTPLSIFALQVLAPTLLVVAILGVVRGFFQGMGTMVPSAASQLLEQIVNACVSIWTAYMLYGYGKKISAVLGNDSHFGEAYGAAGGTIGTSAGAVTALLFVVLVFLAYRPRYRQRFQKDRVKSNERYGMIFKALVMTIIPVLLSTTIFNIINLVDMGIFKRLAAYQGYEAEQYSTMWGVFSGKYMTMVNVPTALASSLAASSVPSITTAFAARNKKQVRRKVRMVNRFIMAIAIPCAVGMAILAPAIIQLIYPAKTTAGEAANVMAGELLRAGSISIIFYSLATVSNAILQGVNRMRQPVYHALIALAAHVGMLLALMLAFDMNIYAVVLANTFFSLVICVLNARAISKNLRCKQEIARTFVIPLLSAAIMGGAVYGTYYALHPLAGNAVATLTSIALGVIIYFVLMILLRGLTERDLRGFPGGGLMVRIAKKMHLLR